MLCTTAINTSNTIRTQTGAGRTPLQRSGFSNLCCYYVFNYSIHLFNYTDAHGSFHALPPCQTLLPSVELFCVCALLTSPIPGHCVQITTSSIKPEVHIVSQRRQRRTEPQHTHTHTHKHTHTHTRLTALFRDYPGEPVPER